MSIGKPNVGNKGGFDPEILALIGAFFAFVILALVEWGLTSQIRIQSANASAPGAASPLPTPAPKLAASAPPPPASLPLSTPPDSSPAATAPPRIEIPSRPAEQTPANAVPLNTAPVALRALSLKVLQQQLQAEAKGRKFSKNVLEFGGIKRLMGYVVDRDHQDLIVYGQSEPASAPALHLEDLVIALRNAWLRYAPLERNTYQYSYPGCSIDPDPATIARLDQIGQQLQQANPAESMSRVIESWHRTCKEWQRVVVLGVPFNSRFAQVMVKADYDMKLLVDGSDAVPVPGLESLTGMKLAEVRKVVLNNQPIKVSLVGMNRFWFYPGANRYQEQDGVVWIQECPIRLLTEPTTVSTSGNYVPTGGKDPLAMKFADDLTLLYEKVAAERPIYAELEGLFRIVALAKLLHSQSAPERAGVDLSYLLNDFSVEETRVDTRLPGRSAVQEFKHEQKLPDGVLTTQFWLPSCGGVGINIDARSEQIKRTMPELAELQPAILRARPSPDALLWDAGVSVRAAGTLRRGARLAEFNRWSRRSPHFSVVDIKDGYELFGPYGLLYSGNSVPDLVKVVNGAVLPEHSRVFLHTEGFSHDKAAGFRRTCRMQQFKLQKKLAIWVAHPAFQSEELSEALFSPGVRFDKARSFVDPEKPEARFTFVTKSNGQLVDLDVRVVTGTKESASALFQDVVDFFSEQEAVPEPLPDVFMRRIEDLIQKHGIKYEDIYEQLGNMEIGVWRQDETGKNQC
jgi:uncharacterized protein DUF1598